ncbi:MAG: hypothetical protein HOV81_33080 [Kofleriaceae bacterium]|nr:hypothetical protein [Kofleriaceae bacterium]
MVPTGVLLAGCSLLAGCLDGASDDVEVSETAQYATVSSYTSSGCSTAVVIGLSKQIADEISCQSPTLLKRFEPTTRLQITSSAVLPYLHSTAKTDLEAVASTRTVQINSAFRTLPQQYLLYRWYQQGRCGITAAATPGRSNHQSGRAIDVSNYSTLISAMSAKGWAHDVPGDAVHFDHLSSPDIRGKDVLAFQRLWNRNHPADKIAEDGAYGPQTEARLKQAPATGFAIGPTCMTPNMMFAVDVLSVDGPDRAQPQSRAHYRVTLQNNGQADWPGTAVLRVASGTTQLHDPSWISPTEISDLGAPIAAGTMGEIAFDITTPAVTEETPIFEQLELSDGGSTIGTVNIALTVVPGMEEPTSGEADDQYDAQEVAGGCSATGGGSSSTGVVLGLALVALARRRRR